MGRIIMSAKKLLTFASAASTLIPRVTVAKFESTMMTSRFKGGEFYEKCTREYGALYAKQWNSSVKQPWSVGEGFPMPVGVAAWMMFVQAFSFAPLPPHNALCFLDMKICQLCLQEIPHEVYTCYMPRDRAYRSQACSYTNC